VRELKHLVIAVGILGLDLRYLFPFSKFAVAAEILLVDVGAYSIHVQKD